MLSCRIIPCLDVNDGRVVKGIRFKELRDAGDPVAIAKAYEEQGADELVFLDITASHEGRGIMRKVVEKTADTCFMPLTVGGGLRTVEDIRSMLQAGADKVSLNSSALKNPELVKEASERFGASCIVVAVDARRKADTTGWEVFSHGGRHPTGRDAIEWIQEVAALGAGEILLTSMDCDGHKEGFALELNQAVCDAVNVPVIASGGAGSMEDFLEVFTKTKVDAGLAASIFHFGEIKIQDLKEYLKKQGVDVRC